jgi:formate dehydrogenase maturation protein FdhE
MKFKAMAVIAARLFLMCVLFASTLTILIDRFLFHKIPTQISAAVVYAVIALNIFVLVVLFQRLRLKQVSDSEARQVRPAGSAPSTRMGKS